MKLKKAAKFQRHVEPEGEAEKGITVWKRINNKQRKAYTSYEER
jgi:hypothetical protein